MVQFEPVKVVQFVPVSYAHFDPVLVAQFMRYFHQFLKEFNLEGINHKVDVQHGIPHEIILHTVKKYSHDLLVMGTNGRTGLNRLVMGSITEKVTREMPCSFVTTKRPNYSNNIRL